VSIFRLLQELASTFRLDVSTLRGLFWEVAVTNTSKAKLRSGRLLCLRVTITAQVELRSGRGKTPAGNTSGEQDDQVAGAYTRPLLSSM